MINRLLKRTLLVIGFLAIFAIGAKAQSLQQMTISASDATFTKVSYSTQWGYADDTVYAVTIPFTFKFDGKDNTVIYVSSNGYICFSPYTNYSAYTSDLSIVYPSVTALRWDLYLSSGPWGVSLQGTAPNRVVVFQWENNQYCCSDYGASNNFQIKLYETSNQIDICYGTMNSGSYNVYTEHVGFSASSTDWINVQPASSASNFTFHFSSKNPSPNNASSYVTNSTIHGYLANKTISLTSYPGFIDVYPKDGVILTRGSVYSGTQHPSMSFNRIAGQTDIYAYYVIAGPLPASNPDYKVIYRGVNPPPNNGNDLIYFNPQPVGSPKITNIPYAIGIAAGANGDLDLSTNQAKIPGGEYSVESQMVLPAFNYVQNFPTQKFIIALADDLALTTLNSPSSNETKKYPQTATIPVQVRVSNIGINPVYEFGVRINFELNGQIVYTDTVHWSNATPLSTGEFVLVNFASYHPRYVGNYKVTAWANLLSSTDQEPSNNYFPRASAAAYYFEIAYEIEAEAIAVVAPGAEVYVRRPFIPIGRFRNNGVSDMSDVPASMYIVRMTAPFDTVFKDNIIIQDLASGKVNTSDVYFSQNFIPPSAGSYKACITVSSPDDPVTSNNSFCQIFQVVDAMSGTYTIGTTMSGSRNFATFDDALNALYLKGLTGPVVFELTDANYNVGDLNLTGPAIDLSSNIIGVSSTNTITFKPSTNRLIGKASVNINMYSGAGIGVQMGQNVLPSHFGAAVNGVTSSLKKVYARSEGNIIFDGGSQKSLKFRLNTNNPFRAAFYMLEGSKNIALKNLLIEDAAPNLTSTAIPLTKFDIALTQFSFEPNTRTGNITYSSGILMRGMAPFDAGKLNSNILKLDTVAINNILITNNEISGFGYGLVDLGIGPLKNAGPDKYQRYYNNNNEVSYNTFYNIGRAGMFIGHEENSKFMYNKVYNVGGTNFADAAGIIAGGEGNTSYNGYNNIGLSLNGNEISNVNSNTMTYGIKVEQCRNGYPAINPSFVYFPDVAESMIITNNAIWGLNVANGNTGRAGIHLLTSRTNANVDALTKMLTPSVTNYWTRNDKICNNTIRIPWDGGMMNTGVTAGIGVQQATGAIVMNNAIALEDNDVLSSSPVYAGLFYQGAFPKNGNFRSDRNVFWSTTNSGASVVRFVEMDGNNNIVDTYNRDDFKTLSQWQQWTKQDMYSIFGNFTGDLVYLGAEPNQRLRVITSPQPPMGSLLNNRGEKLTWNTNDIDGNVRGSSGQRYDIGASEFTGRMFISDVEGLTVTQPGSYKVSVGTFADAEYIMTKAPIDVKCLVRNNGNIQQFGVACKVRIYRELPNGTFSSTFELEKSTTVDIPSSETVEVGFNLADFVGLNFYPRTYGELRGLGYVLPDQFVSMEANVTPRYKIEIGIQADQNNSNNVFSKVVRFYLMKSNLRVCVSNENSNTTLIPTSTVDQIAGRLNYDSVMKAFKRFGWKINIDADPPVYDYDIFDRLGWEPKAVNYNMFRTVVWSDGNDKDASNNDKALTRFQRSDIRRFLDQGNTNEKKNLIAASQELVRNLSQNNANNDVTFLKDIFRSVNATPGNPMGANGSYAGNTIKGVSLERNLVEKVVSTGYLNDVPPYCGLMTVNPAGEGLAQPAYFYQTRAAGVNDSIVGVTTTTLTRNVVGIGIDWRHFSNINMVFRAAIDFIEKNGGTIIPVELLDLTATVAGNRVDLNWTTASEYKSDKFEIERAVINQAGKSDFSKIAEEKASGKSESVKYYGPVSDRNVETGNRYSYRLKMLDIDGKYSYSNEVEVALDGTGTWLGVANPNPANGKVSVSFSANSDQDVTITLFDVSGKNAMNIFKGIATAGENTASFDVSNLPSGSYNIVFKSGNSSFIRQIQVVK